ncbi:Calpain-B [Hypsibius exemplaris]|uniref:Calpain-B n=1 Tax=Hypsibius exemplaris TaxID=2072580 RepID=A0A1W0WFN3_HYPEX|nr:Calpain-B [Hypsibius exemplaris]
MMSEQRHQSRAEFQFHSANSHTSAVSSNGKTTVKTTTTRSSNNGDGLPKTATTTETRVRNGATDHDDVTADPFGASSLSPFDAEYARLATQFFQRFAAQSSVLRSGCLFSSCHKVRSSPKGADIVDGGPTSTANSAEPILKKVHALTQQSAPRPVPFGHVGGSSRRGYTVAAKTFAELRADCLQRGVLFEDSDFPAVSSSVFHTQRFMRQFEWKRPHQITPNPKLIVDGAKRFDMVQGELGDCWLVAAAADLTLNAGLLAKVVPHDQGFTQAEKYCGIFHFQLWRHGQWIDVVVDDRLPTYQGKLMFLHSPDNSEFWSALLEKAYAKVNGSYENLKGGTASEAMEDFTGGLSEFYELNKAPTNLFSLMEKSFQLGAMMSCSIEATAAQLESKLPNGLVMGHAYSITEVKMLDVMTPNKAGKIPCIRLRNPWGASEWKGAFSDGSKEWSFVPENVKKQLDVSFKEDGEFWMSFPDVLTHFDKLEICNLGPETMVSADMSFVRRHKVTWESNVFSGAWTRGVSAGGCRNFLDTFHLNPQYHITLRETDGADGLASCIVALMQKDRRKLKTQGLDLLTVGFAIYTLPPKAPTPLNKDFFRYNASVARSPAFVNSRQVTTRFRLPPGDYCIIPSTFEPNEEADFLLRLYSEVRIDMKEHDNGPAQVLAQTIKEVAPLLPVDRQQRDEVINLFEKIAGANQEIDANDLGVILSKGLKTHFNFKGFSPEIVRSMVTMSDIDFSGRLGLEEFTSLWATIKKWKDTFASYDKTKDGKIKMQHMREAMESAGYLVNNHVLRVIALRYGQTDQTIYFEDFVLCIVRLQRMISIFQSKDEMNLKSAIFSFDDWMLNTMYT